MKRALTTRHPPRAFLLSLACSQLKMLLSSSPLLLSLALSPMHNTRARRRDPGPASGDWIIYSPPRHLSPQPTHPLPQDTPKYQTNPPIQPSHPTAELSTLTKQHLSSLTPYHSICPEALITIHHCRHLHTYCTLTYIGISTYPAIPWL